MTATLTIRLVMLSRESPSSYYLARQLSLFNECELQAIISESTSIGRFQLLHKKVGIEKKRKGALAALWLVAQTPYLLWRERWAARRQRRAWGLSIVDKYPAAVSHHVVNDLNNDAARELLDRYKPDLIFVFGARILKPHIFNSSRLGAINLHAGITPEYRGAKSEFWALYRDDRKMVGHTIHWIDEGIDTGDVLLQKKIDVRKDDDDIDLRIKNIEAAVDTIRLVISQISEHSEQQVSTSGRISCLFSTPTVLQYIKLYLRRRFIQKNKYEV